MIVRLCLSIVVLTIIGTAPLNSQTDRAERKRLAAVLKSDPAAPLRLAKLDGKYRMLLRQIRVEEPGDDLIIDRGSRTVTTYRGHKDLPSGYWVYARPYWFIRRDAGAEATQARVEPRADHGQTRRNGHRGSLHGHDDVLIATHSAARSAFYPASFCSSLACVTLLTRCAGSGS